MRALGIDYGERRIGLALSDATGLLASPWKQLSNDANVGAAARRLAAEVRALQADLQDERLTSHEADELLARREHDWRKRKKQVDAMAAAVILQEFLDHIPRP